MRLFLIPLLLVITSTAAAQPVEVVEGQDLLAWRKIVHEELNAEQRAEVYAAFIHDYPSSPLAEVAYARLDVEQRAQLQPRGVVLDLQRSLDAHDLVLDRINGEVAVAPLGENGDVPDLEQSWAGTVHLGATLDGSGAWGTVGARLGRGAWSGCLRVARGPAWAGDATARLSPSWWGPLFVEGGARLTQGGVVQGLADGGLRTRLLRDAWLETSLGVAAGQTSTPIARVELAIQAF